MMNENDGESTAVGAGEAPFRPTTKEITHVGDYPAELTQLFNLSLQMLCVAGTDGYFKQLNPAFEKTLGYSYGELLSRPFLDFVHPDDRERTSAEVRKITAGEPTVQFENRYRRKDGTYRWLAWTAAPATDFGDDVTLVVIKVTTQ